MIDKLYLTKIGVGMLAVFAVGMVVASAIGRGTDKVREIVSSDSPIKVPLFGMPFITTKGELGTLRSLRIDRSSPRTIDGFRLDATLNDGVDASQFANCEITLADPEHFDKDSRFTCLTEADPGYDSLVKFGTITFEPSGQTHRLMIPAAMRDKIREAGEGVPDAPVPPAAPDPSAVAAAAANAASGAISQSSEAGSGGLSLRINGKQMMDIHGNDSSGRVLIRDPRTGKVLVDINGGPDGGKVRINDSSGKNLTNLDVDS